MWADDEIGRTSVGPWTAPKASACKSGRVWGERTLWPEPAAPLLRKIDLAGPGLGGAAGAARRAARADASRNQIHEHHNDDGHPYVINVLEVVTPALPAVTDFASNHCQPHHPADRA